MKDKFLNYPLSTIRYPLNLMRANFGIILTLLGVLVALVALNAASYAEIETPAETESQPNRSTTNAGATGTRAFYELLEESGYKTTRWRTSLTTLAPDDIDAMTQARTLPATLVIIGRTRRQIESAEASSIMQWVAAGGRLVIVDRHPNSAILGESGIRQIIATHKTLSTGTDPKESTTEKLIAGISPLAPAQPTLLTRDVERVLPSRLAARFVVDESETPDEPNAVGIGMSSSSSLPPPPVATPPPAPAESSTPDNNVILGEASDADAEATNQDVDNDDESVSQDEDEDDAALYRSPAHVAHIADDGGALLVDYTYGRGRIVLLGDPFLVANNGIRLADNAVLALNLVGSPDGVIAFDEYHQGLLAPQNEILAYFQGTPVFAFGAQGLLLICVWLWSRGRRFARPVPLPVIDRRSKLEFIASMSELLKRARAHDLAIENLYRRTRPALARFAGCTADAPRAVIARGVAERSGTSAEKIETLMRDCEDVINGTQVTAARALELAAGLRQLERELNLRRHHATDARHTNAGARAA